MKALKLLPLTALLALGACDQLKKEDVALETQAQKISYLLGMDNGKNIQSVGIEIDTAAFQQGFAAGIAGTDPVLTEEQIAETVKAFETEMLAKREEMQKAEQQSNELQAEGNAIAGTEFLAANGVKEGVTTTETGLQYKVLTAGTGVKPNASSTVEVHYAGRLLDGTEFDSSFKRGVPAQFGVTQVIAGWTEALQLMPEGSKWELYIPAELAYGPGGTGPIGPNSTLILRLSCYRPMLVLRKA